MPIPSEKRASPRTTLHQIVPFERTASAPEAPGAHGRGLAHGVGRDISPTGASLLTDCDLRQGEVLRLHIPVEEERASVPVFSEVKWIQPTRHGFRIGLQFLA